jgi:hypothetical protein
MRTPLIAVCLLAAALLTTVRGTAAEIFSARLRLQPEAPYVNQPFTLRLEIEVTPGAQLQEIQLENLPIDSFAKTAPYQQEERRQVRRSENTVDILSFVTSGRPVQPVQQLLQGVLRAQLVERTSMGFFTTMRSVNAGVRMAPLHLNFRPLPAIGIPDGFRGAVGTFQLTATLDPPQVTPGDLITLTYRVTGSGWLGDTQIRLPAADPNFRSYPPQELQRTEQGELSVRQVVVPLNTNAVSVGAARLPYFDPVAGRYRESVAGPYRLEFVANAPTNVIPKVKHFDVQPLPPPSVENGEAAVAATVNHLRRLLPLAGALLVAMLVAGLLYRWRPRVALAVGLVLLVAGAYCGQWWSRQTGRELQQIHQLATARLCPSPQSRTLFHISPGRSVTILETHDDWHRVDYNGQRGWIPANTLRP